MSIYTCPHCGKKAFGPFKKALAGQMNSKGKPCSHCGGLCVNGTGATIFNAVFCLAAIIAMVWVFLNAGRNPFVQRWEVPIQICIVLAIIIIPRLVNAFFFKMTEAIRIGSR